MKAERINFLKSIGAIPIREVEGHQPDLERLGSTALLSKDATSETKAQTIPRFIRFLVSIGAVPAFNVYHSKPVVQSTNVEDRITYLTKEDIIKTQSALHERMMESKNEPENLTEESKHKSLFFNLVITFQQAAFQHMGKIHDPITGKIERDIEQAKMAIDMLDMINERTKGNLANEETRMLDHILREVKLNYIVELAKDKRLQKDVKPNIRDLSISNIWSTIKKTSPS